MFLGCPSSSMLTPVTDWVSNSWFIIQSDRRGNACTPSWLELEVIWSHITSNFLASAIAHFSSSVRDDIWQHPRERNTTDKQDRKKRRDRHEIELDFSGHLCRADFAILTIFCNDILCFRSIFLVYHAENRQTYESYNSASALDLFKFTWAFIEAWFRYHDLMRCQKASVCVSCLCWSIKCALS